MCVLWPVIQHRHGKVTGGRDGREGYGDVARADDDQVGRLDLNFDKDLDFARFGIRRPPSQGVATSS